MSRRDDHHYSLVEKEVIQLLKDVKEVQLMRLKDEITFRLDILDPSIDEVFMAAVLRRIPDFLEGVPPAPASKRHTNDLEPKKSIDQSLSGSIEDQLLAREIHKGLEEGEEIFKSSGQDFVKPEPSKYNLSQTHYKPKRPKFYNKIKLGVVWNKYAQTHYDEDNPPPKQALGYKFNILYTDLMDMKVAPRYKIEPSDDPTHILLRFSAGPPYEDLVFKIVNKEWDIDRKYGFHSQFEQGVLQLYFHFKKDKYRR